MLSHHINQSIFGLDLVTLISFLNALIGMSPGPFSCIAGNIIASYYLGSELDTAGITNPNDQLIAVRLSPHPTGASEPLTDQNVVLNVWCLACCFAGTHLAAIWGRKPTAILSQCLLIMSVHHRGSVQVVR